MEAVLAKEDDAGRCGSSVSTFSSHIHLPFPYFRGFPFSINRNFFVPNGAIIPVNLLNDPEMRVPFGVLPLHKSADCALLRFLPLFLSVFLAFACAVFGLTLGGCGSFFFRRRVFPRSSTSVLWLRRLGRSRSKHAPQLVNGSL